MKIYFNYFKISRVLVKCLCLLLAFSCQKETIVNAPTKLNANFDTPVYQYILSLGFSKDKIIDKGDFYLVDGDIKFDKYSDKGARPGHSIFSGRPIINYDVVNNITVRVEDNFSNSTWRNNVITATAEAVANWNNINNSKLQLTYTAGPSATITVRYRNLSGTNYYGIGAFPTNCNAGPTVDLASSTSSLSASQLKYLITHELGHCIGFRHTDEGSNSGFHIPGTPYTETGSVMNSAGTTEGNTVPQWQGFSTYDAVATSIIYPTTAYADADDYDSITQTIKFKWTVAYFCNTSVQIDAYDNGVKVKSSPATNNGLFSFSTTGLSPGITYEFEVYDPNNPNRKLYDSTSF